jgi:hypothetical protein
LTTQSNPSRLRRFVRLMLFGVLGLSVLGSLSFVVLNKLGLLGDVVEAFRKVTGAPGTRLVRWAEEIYFEARYDVSVWWKGDEAKNTDEQTALALVVSDLNVAPMPRARQLYDTPESQATSQVIDLLIPHSETIPWTPYYHTDGRHSGIYAAQLFLNDQLPNEPIYLAWIDPRQLNFHWVSGSEEPQPPSEGESTVPSEIPTGINRSGRVPKEDHDKLVAAFNGGYLSKHGAFGAKFNEKVLVPPRSGLATAAITQDHRMLLGEWGRDLDPKDKNIVGFRQNLRLIVDHGEVHKDIKRRAYGATRLSASNPTDPLSGDLKAHTWRSGLGITKEGALIFAAGDFLDGELLAEALRSAGAERAMQLDVNSSYFCVFVFFEPNEKGRLEPLVLGPKMTPTGGKFVYSANKKDFAYITRK